MNKEEHLAESDIEDSDFETSVPDTVEKANENLLREEPAGKEAIDITKDVDDEVTKALQIQSQIRK